MDNSYQRVKKFRKKLQQERKNYMVLMVKIGSMKVYNHLESGGLDRFRILRNNSFNIGLAYIQELAVYMAGHHKIQTVEYYIDKYSKELL